MMDLSIASRSTPLVHGWFMLAAADLLVIVLMVSTSMRGLVHGGDPILLVETSP